MILRAHHWLYPLLAKRYGARDVARDGAFVVAADVDARWLAVGPADAEPLAASTSAVTADAVDDEAGLAA